MNSPQILYVLLPIVRLAFSCVALITAWSGSDVWAWGLSVSESSAVTGCRGCSVLFLKLARREFGFLCCRVCPPGFGIQSVLDRLLHCYVSYKLLDKQTQNRHHHFLPVSCINHC